ncbi:MAG TPA: TetR/AcrR family transcriptional regulator [Burkholderiales bacterium]|nr:TetR/AcrR family transcriptional regulator [Burkholderiales bacterium]
MIKRARRRGAERIGLRERRKLATRERIRTAAADLFTRHGYGAATMREIAQRAHVGLGTLFNYAEDKRDLVFLIFNEELNAVTDVALAAPRPDQPLVDQLVAVFGVHYRWLAGKPALARILLQELTFYSSGKQAATFLGIRKRLIDGLEALVRAAQRARRIRSREDPALIARHIFFVYSASLRWWIAAPRPNPGKGVADLRRLLKLQADGLR